MDPNACWKEIMGILNQDRPIDDDDLERFQELCEAMLNWLHGGGFVPDAAVSLNANRDAFVSIVTAMLNYHPF